MHLLHKICGKMRCFFELFCAIFERSSLETFDVRNQLISPMKKSFPSKSCWTFSSRRGDDVSLPGHPCCSETKSAILGICLPGLPNCPRVFIAPKRNKNLPKQLKSQEMQNERLKLRCFVSRENPTAPDRLKDLGVCLTT